MTKTEIQSRKLYLDTLMSQLSLEDNAAVTSEMTARAKQVEGILKALVSANVNCDNIPGISIYTKLEKNLVIKKYLKDLFFFDTLKLSKTSEDRILVAEAKLNGFAKGEKLLSKDEETYSLMKLEFSKVLDQINNCLSYFQIEDIEVIVDYDKPISRIYIKLLPSDSYLDYLKKIKFIPIGKFITKN